MTYICMDLVFSFIYITGNLCENGHRGFLLLKSDHHSGVNFLNIVSFVEGGATYSFMDAIAGLFEPELIYVCYKL